MAARHPTATSLLSLAVRVALTLASVPAAAQQSGGEAPDAEIQSTPGAAEILRERAVVRLQILQSLQGLRALRAGGAVLPGTASASPHDTASPHDGFNPNAAALSVAADRSALNAQAALAAATWRSLSKR